MRTMYKKYKFNEYITKSTTIGNILLKLICSKNKITLLINFIILNYCVIIYYIT
jgi:hypothetical protein